MMSSLCTADELFERHWPHLEHLSSLRALELWRDALIEHNTLDSGSMAALWDHSRALGPGEEASKAIAQQFDAWDVLLAKGSHRVKESGGLRPEPDGKSSQPVLLRHHKTVIFCRGRYVTSR
jgi:hypothetical protein